MGALIIQFIQRAVIQGTALLFGSTGEIVTEKSGNLNLGIPGIMYIGGISGVIGGFLYQNSAGKSFVPILAILITLFSTLLGSLIASLIYCFLTVTLRANQNVTGLALTTFGVGFGNFFGGSLIRVLHSDAPFIALTKIAKAYKKPLPFAGKLGWFGEVFLSYGFMVYLAIAIAVTAAIILKRTRVGLHLRAVGESPATADAAGINVTRYRYISTCIGGMIAGLGGLYYVMDYCNGVWSNGAFGDRGWLAIALVIFATWKPLFAILGSYLFGALYVLYNYVYPFFHIVVDQAFNPIIQMLPYLVTILVLVIVSIRDKKENQPPQGLGSNYYREDR